MSFVNVNNLPIYNYFISTQAPLNYKHLIATIKVFRALLSRNFVLPTCTFTKKKNSSEFSHGLDS